MTSKHRSLILVQFEGLPEKHFIPRPPYHPSNPYGCSPLLQEKLFYFDNGGDLFGWVSLLSPGPLDIRGVYPVGDP